MAHRERFASPLPLIIEDPEAWGRLPPAVQSAMRRHSGDSLLTALEKILRPCSQAQRIEILREAFRAAYGADMESDGGEGETPLPA